MVANFQVAELQVIKQAFSFVDGIIDFGALVAGNDVLDCELEITTPFDDPAAVVTLGLTSATGSILNSAQIDPTSVGTYHSAENIIITISDGIRIQVVPGTSTQGAGRAIITIRRGQ